MKTVLVSLVSDQTIPNIEFIREKSTEVNAYLFISTKGMESKGAKNWILNTVNLGPDVEVTTLEIEPFSFNDIEQKLQAATNDNDKYLVNLTGGTKIMSLAIFDFFKGMNTEMYYLIGNGQMMKVHPGKNKPVSNIQSEISIQDYFTAYGFNIKKQGQPLMDDLERYYPMLNYHLHHFDTSLDANPLAEIRQNRERKKMNITEDVNNYLNRIKFKPASRDVLTKEECRFLTGDWLEDFFYLLIINHLNLSKDKIGLGLQVVKNNTNNELDVVFVNNNKIFIFECKTSIYTDAQKKENILANTIYKSDSLRNKFGLMAQTTIVTLSDLNNDRLKVHLERAEASNVKFIGKADFDSQQVATRIQAICGIK